MLRRVVSRTVLAALLVAMLFTAFKVRQAEAWSNGGFSSDPSNPNYGTHDWIAQHALDWLPVGEKEYIAGNLAVYLYGTELPDNGAAPDGIGDTALHHIYYWSNESLQDDASAVRAQTEYNNAKSHILSNDVIMAVKTLGIMSHYIVDVGAFGHVMGVGTDWGPEIHHSDYESYANERTNSYIDEFNTYLVFDGSLDDISAYDASCTLAYDTTFDVDGDLTCVWMDQNYDWSNQTFRDRCGESLNLAVNLLTDVLHTFYMEFIHDVAVTETASYKTVIGQGFPLKVNVTVKNEGEFPQTFNVTAYANATAIETEEVTLMGGSSTTVAFTWSTTGVAKGNHTIKAEATILPGETDTLDNTHTDGWVCVAIVGDINADGIVDITDIYLIALAFGAMPPDPRYDPNLDIIYDQIIDISDIYTAAIHFGEIDP